ncbi:hypothetical protein EBT25_18425, partial [bacterium]|nr:hypothetical protein [bacterium]
LLHLQFEPVCALAQLLHGSVVSGQGILFIELMNIRAMHIYLTVGIGYFSREGMGASQIQNILC